MYNVVIIFHRQQQCRNRIPWLEFMMTGYMNFKVMTHISCLDPKGIFLNENHNQGIFKEIFSYSLFILTKYKENYLLLVDKGVVYGITVIARGSGLG